MQKPFGEWKASGRKTVRNHDIYDDPKWLINLVETSSITRIENGDKEIGYAGEIVEEVNEEG